MKQRQDRLKWHKIETPLGAMMAVADEEALFFLEFEDQKGIDNAFGHLSQEVGATISPGMTSVHHTLKKELDSYFKGMLKEFKTPLHIMGSPFQRGVWEELQRIPFGETRSYAELAKAIGRPTAFRAVAQANGANRLALIVPCHRVVYSNGSLGGYAGGVNKKKWLLSHEKASFR